MTPQKIEAQWGKSGRNGAETEKSVIFKKNLVQNTKIGLFQDHFFREMGVPQNLLVKINVTIRCIRIYVL